MLAEIQWLTGLFDGTLIHDVIGRPSQGLKAVWSSGNNINNRVFQSYVIYGFVAAVYFVCCYGLSLIGQHLLERLDPASRASTERVLPRPSASA